MIIIFYIILLCIYVCLPLPLQVVAFIVNAIFPDPIPVVDEAIMIMSMFDKIKKACKIMDFVEKAVEFYHNNKNLCRGALVALIIIIIMAL